jgi:hypothetical protein
LQCLAGVVSENRELEAKAWSNSDELLAIIADRLGVVGAEGFGFKKPLDRIRRPYEPEEKKGMSAVSFIRAMAAGNGKRRREVR